MTAAAKIDMKTAKAAKPARGAELLLGEDWVSAEAVADQSLSEGRAKRSILAIGRLTNEIPSLNLAEIRQRAATLGADEVHVHLLATSMQEAQAVEVDLRTAQFATKSN